MESGAQSDIGTWKELSRLLDTGLALDAGQREAWLAGLPAAHAALLPQLRRMILRSAGGDDSFLQKPVALAGILGSIESADDQPGDVIGPYTLIRRIGAGGMATIWIAEKSDGTLRRQVALKLPISVWARGLAERMRRERDILASLEHPNIARLYDAGVTEQGRPYLALEYIDGLPIDAYCQKHRCDIQARLQLFLQVANAVSHAHGKLVVHRDLKPNNILVTPAGEVRLLDFGIAKLLETDVGDPDARDSNLTRLGGRALTLDYASPEQIRAERVTIASDVYSLGVVLYELLTGRLPYKPRRRSQGAVEEAILEQEPPLASKVAEPPVARMLRGDLDVILAKALKKRIASRYASVESFAADVSRYMAGEPVLAQPDSTWYRTRKFVRRNAGAVAACAAIFLAIGAGSALAVWQARVARIEAARAEEVKRFVASIFSNAKPRERSGGAVLAADLLTAASARIESELAGNPRAAAELGVIIGESFGELGLRRNGEPVLRMAVDRAERELGPRHPITLRGKVQLGAVIKDWDPAAAEALIDQVIVDAARALPESADSLEGALTNKAFIAARRNDEAGAYRSMREAVSVAEKYLGNHSESAIFNLGFLANLYGKFGRKAEQLQAASEAMQRAKTAFADRRPHIILAAAERFYASALRENGRPGDAVPILRQALADQMRLDAVETLRVRNAVSDLALALHDAGETREAIELFRRVVGMEVRQNNFESMERVEFGIQLVESLIDARMAAEALAEDLRVEALLSRLPPRRPDERAADVLRRAQILALQGKGTQSDRLAAEAAGLAGVASPALRVRAMRIAAFNERLQGHPELADDYINQALHIARGGTDTGAEAIWLPVEHGMSLLRQGKADAAHTEFAKCLERFRQQQVRPSVKVSDCVLGAARSHLALGRADQAAKLLTELAADWQRTYPSSGWHGEVMFWLARAEYQLGNTVQAADIDARARRFLRNSPIPSHASLLASRNQRPAR